MERRPTRGPSSAAWEALAAASIQVAFWSYTTNRYTSLARCCVCQASHLRIRVHPAHVHISPPNSWQLQCSKLLSPRSYAKHASGVSSWLHSVKGTDYEGSTQQQRGSPPGGTGGGGAAA
jgi:hypothetical protein